MQSPLVRGKSAVAPQWGPRYVHNLVAAQFASKVVMTNRVTGIGLEDLARRAAHNGVQLKERVYPLLDHVESPQTPWRSLLALRRSHYCIVQMTMETTWQ